MVRGALFMDTVGRHGATLLPIDSEHSAVFQCLPGTVRAGDRVVGILLTASGGRFRQRDPARMWKLRPGRPAPRSEFFHGPQDRLIPRP